jgi:hypothetical protein
MKQGQNVQTNVRGLPMLIRTTQGTCWAEDTLSPKNLN